MTSQRVCTNLHEIFPLQFYILLKTKFYSKNYRTRVSVETFSYPLSNNMQQMICNNDSNETYLFIACNSLTNTILVLQYDQIQVSIQNYFEYLNDFASQNDIQQFCLLPLQTIKYYCYVYDIHSCVSLSLLREIGIDLDTIFIFNKMSVICFIKHKCYYKQVLMSSFYAHLFQNCIILNGLLKIR